MNRNPNTSASRNVDGAASCPVIVNMVDVVAVATLIKFVLCAVLFCCCGLFTGVNASTIKEAPPSSFHTVVIAAATAAEIIKNRATVAICGFLDVVLGRRCDGGDILFRGSRFCCNTILLL